MPGEGEGRPVVTPSKRATPRAVVTDNEESKSNQASRPTSARPGTPAKRAVPKSAQTNAHASHQEGLQSPEPTANVPPPRKLNGFTTVDWRAWGTGHLKYDDVRNALPTAEHISFKGPFGVTPLRLAANHCGGDNESIDSLAYLCLKADSVNSADSRGCTPLHRAADNRGGGGAECVRVLVAYGSDINATDIHGKTPLMLASSKGHLETVLSLLAMGADHTLTAGDKPKTAKDMAFDEGHLPCSKILEDHHPRTDEQIQATLGRVRTLYMLERRCLCILVGRCNRMTEKTTPAEVSASLGAFSRLDVDVIKLVALMVTKNDGIN